MAKPFHVVRHSLDGAFVTYSIYLDNRPYMRPARGRVLGRREAYAFCRLLNGEAPWPR